MTAVATSRKSPQPFAATPSRVPRITPARYSSKRPKKRPKKAVDEKAATPFPPAQMPRKVDLQLESGCAAADQARSLCTAPCHPVMLRTLSTCAVRPPYDAHVPSPMPRVCPASISFPRSRSARGRWPSGRKPKPKAQKPRRTEETPDSVRRPHRPGPLHSRYIARAAGDRYIAVTQPAPPEERYTAVAQPSHSPGSDTQPLHSRCTAVAQPGESAAMSPVHPRAPCDHSSHPAPSTLWPTLPC